MATDRVVGVRTSARHTLSVLAVTIIAIGVVTVPAPHAQILSSGVSKSPLPASADRAYGVLAPLVDGDAAMEIVRFMDQVLADRRQSWVQRLRRSHQVAAREGGRGVEGRRVRRARPRLGLSGWYRVVRRQRRGLAVARSRPCVSLHQFVLHAGWRDRRASRRRRQRRCGGRL